MHPVTPSCVVAISHTTRSRGVRAADYSSSEGLSSAPIGLRDTPACVAPLSLPPTLSARSGRVPREPLDAPENLPQETPRQVALPPQSRAHRVACRHLSP